MATFESTIAPACRFWDFTRSLSKVDFFSSEMPVAIVFVYTERISLPSLELSQTCSTGANSAHPKTFLSGIEKTEFR